MDDIFQNIEGYTLYYLPSCVHCHRVIDEIRRLKLSLKYKSISEPANQYELLGGGGKVVVPCLRHPDGRWQYESEEIIVFLKKTFPL